jgi:hypothetical protein
LLRTSTYQQFGNYFQKKVKNPKECLLLLSQVIGTVITAAAQDVGERTKSMMAMPITTTEAANITREVPVVAVGATATLPPQLPVHPSTPMQQVQSWLKL